MYAQLCTWENLLLAYRRASKGKRGHPAVAAFEHRLEDNLLALQHALRTHTYRPGAYTHFIIHEPKRRLRNQPDPEPVDIPDSARANSTNGVNTLESRRASFARRCLSVRRDPHPGLRAPRRTRTRRGRLQRAPRAL